MGWFRQNRGNVNVPKRTERWVQQAENNGYILGLFGTATFWYINLFQAGPKIIKDRIGTFEVEAWETKSRGDPCIGDIWLEVAKYSSPRRPYALENDWTSFRDKTMLKRKAGKNGEEDGKEVLDADGGDIYFG